VSGMRILNVSAWMEPPWMCARLIISTRYSLRRPSYWSPFSLHIMKICGFGELTHGWFGPFDQDGGGGLRVRPSVVGLLRVDDRTIAPAVSSTHARIKSQSMFLLQKSGNLRYDF
jgi:hypothetical protein